MNISSKKSEPALPGRNYKRGLCWIRRDLRLKDHRALEEACAQCEEVIICFVFDTDILKHLEPADRRLTFIHDALSELDSELRHLGSALVIAHGSARAEMPKLASELDAQVVFTNHDYEPSAKIRDAAIRDTLRDQEVEFYTFQDQVIFEGRELLTGAGEPFKMFTPYKRRWLAELTDARVKNYKPKLKALIPAARLKKLGGPKYDLQNYPLKRLGFERQELWLKSGSEAAEHQLKKFKAEMKSYDQRRDFPMYEPGMGTSGLSVHLRFGTLSIRECVRAAGGLTGSGASTWLSELIWRDFYQMILDQYPFVVETAFKEKYRDLKWPGTRADFQRWCQGETGYPLVDAAMRQLNETGWMHNRMRMVVAMFLTKDLLVDYQWGESYFAQHLLDYDCASNNGGWQWSASTGVDSQPYFRIFNPITQSRRFDPKGDYIRRYVPELRELPNAKIHWPSPEKIAGYQQPLVDHAKQRIKALALFRRRA